MNSPDPPKLIEQSAEDLLCQMVKQIPAHFPEWKREVPEQRRDILALADDPADFGMAFLKLAARMGEVIGAQLNRVPEKNFLAFLDLLGIDLLPPRAARVPLTFTLVEKAPRDAIVPKHTRVAVSKADNVVFETDENFTVARASLMDAVAINPEEDGFANLTTLINNNAASEVSLFGSDGHTTGWAVLDHVLYLGHSSLFDLAQKAGVPLNIHLNTDSAVGKLEWECFGEDGWKLLQEASSDQAVSLVLPPLAQVSSQKAILGHDDNLDHTITPASWIRAKTTEPLTDDPLPKITALEATVIIKSGPTFVPDEGLFNNFLLDLSKDFYPFGERPTFNDTFYLASREIFSREGANVILTVTLSDEPNLPHPNSTASLLWQYWNGNQWAEITIEGAAQHFKSGGTITFTCPPIIPYILGDEENYWIRARIISGNYGEKETYTQSTNQELEAALIQGGVKATDRANVIAAMKKKGLAETFFYIPSKIQPPSIKSMTLSLQQDFTQIVTFNPANTDGQGLTVATVNNHVLEWPKTNEFSPFSKQPNDEAVPELYLGFESHKGKPIHGTPLSVFFQILQHKVEGKPLGEVHEEKAALPEVHWSYWNGQEWAPLPVQDETENFSEMGRVRFIGPENFAEHKAFNLSRYWIKASLTAGDFSVPPWIKGILENTVWATHGVALANQVLGSSNGAPNQVFSFSKPPVLEGEIIEVKEPTLPSDIETKQILAESGRDAIRIIRDEAGTVLEVWVMWKSVHTFNVSGALARQYRLDRQKGLLYFGDGVRGLIPPPGRDNIRVVKYRSGGGEGGNHPAGNVTELQTTIPYVATVTNHLPAVGGSNAEDPQEITGRGPGQIKSRERAVTIEDYEWLTYEASKEVAKVRCLPTTKPNSIGEKNVQAGWVTLIVVPDSDEEKPIPQAGLLNTVKTYVENRALVGIAPQINWVHPEYVEVGIETTIIPKLMEEATLVKAQVLDNLHAFLHPIKGGPDGRGWKFGRNVYQSEIARVIQQTEGVSQIVDLKIKAGEERNLAFVEIPDNGLPASWKEEHQVTISHS